MIQLKNALLLAKTKIQGRPFKTFTTIFISSLLFSVLIAISILSNGAIDSISKFRKDDLTGRYIVNVSGFSSNNSIQSILQDPALVSEAKARYESLVNQKKDDARKLGLSYDPAMDQPPYVTAVDSRPSRLNLNDPNGIARAVIAEKIEMTEGIDESKLLEVSKKYSSIDFFVVKHQSIRSGSSLSEFKEGKESFKLDDENQISSGAKFVIDPSQLNVLPEDINNQFLLPNNADWTPESGLIPIILPFNKVEALLGLQSLPESASVHDKIQRIRELGNRSQDLIVYSCYRNSTSSSLIQEALRQQNEGTTLATNTNNSVRYSLPDPETCSEANVVSDTRSISAKILDTNQETFDAKYNYRPEPVSHKIGFKVVGVTPELREQQPDSMNTQESSKELDEIIGSIFSTNGISQGIPSQLFKQIENDEILDEVFSNEQRLEFSKDDSLTRYLEFPDSATAKKFIQYETCSMNNNSSCLPIDRIYQASFAFSNSVALDSIEQQVSEILNYSSLIVAVLAGAIIWFTVGRTISDSRHETAIFRAIGFRRKDIAFIYFVYISLLITAILLISSILGVSVSYIVNGLYTDLLTTQAKLGFARFDDSLSFSLITFNLEDLIKIIVIIIATGFLSSLLPLLLNVRRQPIVDLRNRD